MSKKKLDLSAIKTNDLDETSSFTDLMTRSERLNRHKNIESTDIDDMVNEKRKRTDELTKELEKARKIYNDEISQVDVKNNKKRRFNKEEADDNLAKTQIMELTRIMKFNFEETKEENNKKKNGITFLNIVGISNLICIGFYIYLLTFTNYQDKQNNYLIVGGIIILLVIFFGISVISNRKFRKVFNIFNLITIISFIAFNIYSLLY